MFPLRLARRRHYLGRTIRRLETPQRCALLERLVHPAYPPRPRRRCPLARLDFLPGTPKL